jgi:hypothetical protein
LLINGVGAVIGKLAEYVPGGCLKRVAIVAESDVEAMIEQMAQVSDFGIDRSIVNGSLSFIDRAQSHTPAPTIRLIISGQRCICDASVFVLGNSKGNDPDPI